MRTLRFMLEYGCSPVWVRDGDALIGVGLPENLRHDHELIAILEDISLEYDSLFINNSVEFSYQGFSDREEEAAFEDKIRKSIEMLKAAAGENYRIEVDESIFR